MTTEKDELERVRNRLEHELAHIRDLAAVFRAMAAGAGDLENPIAYLAAEIEDHTENAQTAHAKLFGFNEFAEQRGGPGALVMARIGGAA